MRAWCKLVWYDMYYKDKNINRDVVSVFFGAMAERCIILHLVGHGVVESGCSGYCPGG